MLSDFYAANLKVTDLSLPQWKKEELELQKAKYQSAIDQLDVEFETLLKRLPINEQSKVCSLDVSTFLIIILERTCCNQSGEK